MDAIVSARKFSQGWFLIFLLVERKPLIDLLGCGGGKMLALCALVKQCHALRCASVNDALIRWSSQAFFFGFDLGEK